MYFLFVCYFIVVSLHSQENKKKKSKKKKIFLIYRNKIYIFLAVGYLCYIQARLIAKKKKKRLWDKMFWLGFYFVLLSFVLNFASLNFYFRHEKKKKHHHHHHQQQHILHGFTLCQSMFLSSQCIVLFSLFFFSLLPIERIQLDNRFESFFFRKIYASELANLYGNSNHSFMWQPTINKKKKHESMFYFL